jgi:hypothetical protein
MITRKQFMKALKKRTEADLIVSRYNLQESLRNIELLNEARTIAHTFQNGSRTENECLSEAFKYLKKREDDKTL